MRLDVTEVKPSITRPREIWIVGELALTALGSVRLSRPHRFLPGSSGNQPVYAEGVEGFAEHNIMDMFLLEMQITGGVLVRREMVGDVPEKGRSLFAVVH